MSASQTPHKTLLKRSQDDAAEVLPDDIPQQAVRGPGDPSVRPGRVNLELQYDMYLPRKDVLRPNADGDARGRQTNLEGEVRSLNLT